MAKPPRRFDPIGGYPRDRLDVLLALYQRSKASVDRILSSGTATAFQQFRAAQLKRQIETIITALDTEAMSYAKDVVPLAYKAGADFARESMIAAGMDVDDVNMGARIHTRAVQSVATQITEDLISADASLLRDSVRILRKTQQAKIEERQIHEMIAKGLIEGETRRDVSKRIAAQLSKDLADGARIAVNGRHYDPSYYADMVARTMTREAATEGTLNFGAEYGIDLYQVSVHDNPCVEICASLQGKVFSMSGVDSDFPRLDRRPPFHCNCRHVLTPYVWKTDEERAALSRVSRSRAAMEDQDQYSAALDAAMGG